jgi:hypothetical protein
MNPIYDFTGQVALQVHGRKGIGSGHGAGLSRGPEQRWCWPMWMRPR